MRRNFHSKMTLNLFEQLSQDIFQLYESEHDYNVAIEVGEQPNIQLFKAHSIILHQRSLYFRQNLTNVTKKNSIIEIKLPHVLIKEIDIIIKYIYGGIVSLEKFEASDILDLLITIEEFKLTELIENLQNHLINNEASWLRFNFSRVYKISFYNENFKALQQFCNDIISKQPNMIFDLDDFISLPENALVTLLKRDDLQMDELKIWDKVILWGKDKIPDLPPNLDQ
ncbi:hypothetical protein C2G38_1663318 [Gigaspora rosea]|uniref:BTB domain-containing protein n=1 Tax=Gigaspora rosea TaxID=44941 RepID=A0A397VZH5_9GLOM|nr:hypothetical protein C2G38_1663318 [Gigaspora rosea]